MTPREARLTEREMTAIRLRAQFKTLAEIGRELGVTPQAVHKLLKKAETKHGEEVRDTIIRHKSRLHVTYELIAAEALQAWHQSKRPSTRRTIKRRMRDAQPQRQGGQPQRQGGQPPAAAPSEVVMQTMSEETSPGDPSFLMAVLAAGDRIAKLWGLNAKEGTGGTREPSEFEEMSEPELLRAAEQEIARMRASMTQPITEPIAELPMVDDALLTDDLVADDEEGP